MKDTIEKLERKRKIAQEDLKKIDAAISALQDVCEHKHNDGSDAFDVEGHDSHKTYYVCKICGKTESV